MDKTTEKLASYVTSLTYDQLTPAAIRISEKLLIDALGCAIGGYRGEPSVIARRIAAQATGTPPARVLGSGASSSMDLATFANSVMIRYLDFNDTYTSIGEGHPSDAIPAILAVADAYHASGKDVILAMVAAYEVYMGMADVISLRDKSKQLLVVLEAVESAERDTPEYLDVDYKAMAATFVRTPKLGDVPYAVQMEPNLVVEFYSR